MKTFILSFIILFLFLGYYYFLFQKNNLSNDEYDYTIKNLYAFNEKIVDNADFIKDISSIKNLRDFKYFVQKDSQIVDYQFNEKRNRYRNFIFVFDSSKNLQSITPDFHFAYSTLDKDSSSYYSPIYSYLFSSSDYNLQPNDLVWLFFIFLLALVLISNILLYYSKKKQPYLVRTIFILIFILLINTLQLTLGYKYYLLNESNWMNAAGIPSRLALFKLMGITSHFQSLISDINFITIILLLIFVRKYFKQYKNAV